jgi:hypothetical protein
MHNLGDASIEVYRPMLLEEEIIEGRLDASTVDLLQNWFGLSEQLRGFDKWRSAGFRLAV